SADVTLPAAPLFADTRLLRTLCSESKLLTTSDTTLMALRAKSATACVVVRTVEVACAIGSVSVPSRAAAALSALMVLSAINALVSWVGSSRQMQRCQTPYRQPSPPFLYWNK